MPCRWIFLLALCAGGNVWAREPIPPPSQAIRARTLGIPFDGQTGVLNSITDVPGIEVGYSTLIAGEGKLVVGQGPVRTGVTAILPRGRAAMNDPVFAGYFSLNGNGEMTGVPWLQESGFLEGPIILTNTHSVGVARDAVVAWRLAHGGPDAQGFAWSLPIVAETWDGWLNDVDGFHVMPGDVAHAIETARGGAIEEGSVGGGTGMICYEFKGGNGTASRLAKIGDRPFVVGAFVQANCGRRAQLTIRGKDVGKAFPGSVYPRETGSIIIVLATDAPLLPHQLDRLARRAVMGLARTGSISGNGSGDLFLAFSTANPHAADSAPATHSIEAFSNDEMDALFEATVQATEEAIINALVDNRTMVGRDDHKVEALPQEALKKMFAHE
ncbi:MAG: P1 family peptidase [Verrucomicrobiota bacterium]